jgi:hypothetical protein
LSRSLRYRVVLAVAVICVPLMLRRLIAGSVHRRIAPCAFASQPLFTRRAPAISRALSRLIHFVSHKTNTSVVEASVAMILMAAICGVITYAMSAVGS